MGSAFCFLGLHCRFWKIEGVSHSGAFPSRTQGLSIPGSMLRSHSLAWWTILPLYNFSNLRSCHYERECLIGSLSSETECSSFKNSAIKPTGFFIQWTQWTPCLLLCKLLGIGAPGDNSASLESWHSSHLPLNWDLETSHLWSHDRE